MLGHGSDAERCDTGWERCRLHAATVTRRGALPSAPCRSGTAGAPPLSVAAGRRPRKQVPRAGHDGASRQDLAATRALLPKHQPPLLTAALLPGVALREPLKRPHRRPQEARRPPPAGGIQFAVRLRKARQPLRRKSRGPQSGRWEYRLQLLRPAAAARPRPAAPELHPRGRCKVHHNKCQPQRQHPVALQATGRQALAVPGVRKGRADAFRPPCRLMTLGRRSITFGAVCDSGRRSSAFGPAACASPWAHRGRITQIFEMC